MASILLVGWGLLSLVASGVLSFGSLRHSEHRAAAWIVGLGVGLSLPAWLALGMGSGVQWSVLGAGGITVGVALVVFVMPVGRASWGRDVPQVQLDERDIMFARARLKPGSKEYEQYYERKPELQEGDDKTRSLPGLLSPHAKEADPLLFASAEAMFGYIEELYGLVGGSVAPVRHEGSAPLMTDYVKGLTQYLGAHSVGVARLQSYHVYSHVGRGQGGYGSRIDLGHRYAIAYTVEMAHSMVNTAPQAPTVLESARQYARAAQIAVILADFIRSLGYPARSHVDGNYQVVAPLVARDAGLGEIGRMGLLMTPSLGPRVRLGIVTTDLPLVPDSRCQDTSVLDFCEICAKCAESCPVQAIPYGGRREIDGALRWQIDQEICYRYWCVVGTDCARCMAACPYSHPSGAMHNTIRWAVRRSGAVRRAALSMDRLVFGRTPKPTDAPLWVKAGKLAPNCADIMERADDDSEATT